jgi:hypothetical protein
LDLFGHIWWNKVEPRWDETYIILEKVEQGEATLGRKWWKKVEPRWDGTYIIPEKVEKGGTRWSHTGME